MRIVRLQAEGFKRIEAVDITPEGDLVALGGDNGEGKSSVLDAIFAALGGKAAAPVKPVRTGEEYAIIRLDLGDLKVTRFFGADGADRLRVENAEGAVFTSAQTMLDKLVGSIAFDPLSFAQLDPVPQATMLRKLVKLDVDPDEVARLNKVDYDERRDVNRDGRALKARIDGIILPEGDLGTPPDREALRAALATAAETNSAIERDRLQRLEDERSNERGEANAEGKRRDAEALRQRAENLEREAKEIDDAVAAERQRLAALPPLGELVDTVKLNDDLANADRLAETFRRKAEKDRLKGEFETLKTKSEALTARMDERTASVEKALAAAEMPVPGLSLGRLEDPAKPDEPGDLIVMFEGEPFSQASTAGQIRVSARIAMAMNPKLRVMIVKEGALLDGKNLALLREIAKEGDFQIWLETVGERDGVGIIMEAGKVRGAPEPERLPAPKRRKKSTDPEDLQAQSDSEVRHNVSPGDEFEGSDVAPSAKPADQAAPPRRKPTAMREFTSAKPGEAKSEGPKGLFDE